MKNEDFVFTDNAQNLLRQSRTRMYQTSMISQLRAKRFLYEPGISLWIWFFTCARNFNNLITRPLFAYLFGIICRRLWNTNEPMSSFFRTSCSMALIIRKRRLAAVLQPGKSIIVRDTLQVYTQSAVVEHGERQREEYEYESLLLCRIPLYYNNSATCRNVIYHPS